MYEIVVCIARAIACRSRLRILTQLARDHETTPSALAKCLDMKLDMVSVHLARLVAAGLTRRRRAGAWCYFSLGSPYGEESISGRVASWLRETLAHPIANSDVIGVGQLRDTVTTDDGKLHHTLYRVGTAFANTRRVRIFMYLFDGKVVTMTTLMNDLTMSRAAVSRHISKLLDRGYIEQDLGKPPWGFRLAREFKTPMHAAFLEIVAPFLRRG